MIMTIEELIKELQKFDLNRSVNIVDGIEYTQPNGTKVMDVGFSAIHAVTEIENGNIGILTRAGYDTLRNQKDDERSN